MIRDENFEHVRHLALHYLRALCSLLSDRVGFTISADRLKIGEDLHLQIGVSKAKAQAIEKWLANLGDRFREVGEQLEYKAIVQMRTDGRFVQSAWNAVDRLEFDAKAQKLRRQLLNGGDRAGE